MTPSFMGLIAVMLPGVRPSISLASMPTASMRPLTLFRATIDGSLTTMPRPRAKTQVLAVPRSIARSWEKRARKDANTWGLQASLVPGANWIPTTQMPGCTLSPRWSWAILDYKFSRRLQNGLVSPQRHERVDACRAPRWNEARGDSQERQEQCRAGEGRRVCGMRSEEHTSELQ